MVKAMGLNRVKWRGRDWRIEQDWGKIEQNWSKIEQSR